MQHNGASDILVEVENVKKYYPVEQGIFQRLAGQPAEFVRAVDDVSLTVRRGEVLGLAGESGSGKSTLGRLILNLIKPSAGRVHFDGVDLGSLSAEGMRSMRRHMQFIFQDPMASLNPRMTVGESIAHGYRIHIQPDEGKARAAAEEIMERVGLYPARTIYAKYPHQLSGGQRQRAVIARALITRPQLVVADEPVAMADVSVRALLLDLMLSLKDEFGLTYLFITHDLATAKYICDRIGVLYLGKLVEIGPLRQVYTHPQHPYTEALLKAVPVPDPAYRSHEVPISGEIPNALHPPSGCRFHPRCPLAIDVCSQQQPTLLPAPQAPEDGHVAACHVRTGAYSDHAAVEALRS